MLHRRTLLAVPLAAVAPAWAVGPSWPFDAGEVRLGASGGDAPARAAAAQALLGVRVVAVRAQGAALVRLLDEGHVEAALLDGLALAGARRAMGERLVVLSGEAGGRTRVVRRVLPAGMRERLADVLQG